MGLSTTECVSPECPDWAGAPSVLPRWTRRRAKKERLDIDDDTTFFAVVRAIQDLEANPRPRGYDTVEGQEEIYRIWVGRDWRVLYSIDGERNELVIEAVRKYARMNGRAGRLSDRPGRLEEAAHDRRPLRVRGGVRMTRILTVTLLLSLAAAGLSGCYVVSPYDAPGYGPMYSPPPPYTSPSAPAPGPPRPGGPATAPPPSGAGGAPPGSAQNCQTVTVQGHAETIVRQNGQRETVWVPTHVERVCQ